MSSQLFTRRGVWLPRRRRGVLVPLAIGAALVAMIAAPTVGSTPVSVRAVWDAPWDWANNPDAAIFFVARLPRVLLAALVGATLALAGVTYQALLRNPLASPYTLGVTAGATFAAFVAIRFAPLQLLGQFAVPFTALGGALATTWLVLSLRAGRRGLPPTVLLLAGVTLNFTISAGMMLLQYLADFTETVRMIRWMMGDLEGASYGMLVILALASLPGWIVLLRCGRRFNLLSMGDEEASSHGIDAERATRHGLLWASVVTGLAVAVAGPIGFVGIIVPHAIRLVAGSDHRVLLPVSMACGAAFLIACDALSRTVLAPVELPIGVLTASLGGPLFLLLLMRRGVSRDL